MNTPRQSILLFLLTFLCISTPPVWAQKPAQSSAPASHYTYKVIAKKTAKQDCIFDGRKVTHFDDANLDDFIFTDNGTIIFWAYTDEGHTLCKNSQALAYNGKFMSETTLFDEVNDNVGSVGNAHDPQIFAYNASGDVIYGVWTKTGNSENYAVALNDALVVNPQAHSEASGQIIFGMDGHALSPRFTKDGKYAVPVLVKDVSDTNKNSPEKSKWLVGGTLQDTVPDPDRSASDALRLDHPVGIYADELFKRFLGSNPIIPHVDISQYQYIIPKCRCNRKGQIAMLLSGNGSQVILVATPTNTPTPEDAIQLEEATTTDAQSVSVNYTIKQSGVQSVHFDVYRSSTKDSTQKKWEIGQQDITAVDKDTSGQAALYPGKHTIKLISGISLSPNTAEPFIVVTATYNGQKSTTYFHKYLLGVLVHGYTSFLPLQQFPEEPDWEPTMKHDLENTDHYDQVIVSNWVYESSDPSSRQTIYAGNALYSRILVVANKIAKEHEGDVLDIHLIGHSRGTVVISQILADLVANKLPSLIGSYNEVSLLDPHPANEAYEPMESFYLGDSMLVETATMLAIAKYHIFNKAARDPQITLPSSANIKEIGIWYQHTPAKEFSALSSEHILNLWGHGPNDEAIVNKTGIQIKWHNLTSKGDDKSGIYGHSEVHEYYREFVVETGINWMPIPTPNP